MPTISLKTSTILIYAACVVGLFGLCVYTLIRFHPSGHIGDDPLRLLLFPAVCLLPLCLAYSKKTGILTGGVSLLLCTLLIVLIKYFYILDSYENWLKSGMH